MAKSLNTRFLGDGSALRDEQARSMLEEVEGQVPGSGNSGGISQGSMEGMEGAANACEEAFPLAQSEEEHQEHQEEYQVQEISGRHEDLPGTTLPRHDLPFPLDRAAAGFANQFVSETLLEVQKLIPHATQDLVEELTRVILVCLIILYP